MKVSLNPDELFAAIDYVVDKYPYTYKDSDSARESIFRLIDAVVCDDNSYMVSSGGICVVRTEDLWSNIPHVEILIKPCVADYDCLVIETEY